MSGSQRPSAVCETEQDSPGPRDGAPLVLPGPGFVWVVLQRHGRRPLAVFARALLEAHNRCAGLPTWSHIAFYETAGGRYAVALRHSPSAGPAWADAWLCDSADAVRDDVLAHDPLWAAPLGTPAGDPAPGAAFCAAWTGLLAAVFGRAAVLGHIATGHLETGKGRAA